MKKKAIVMMMLMVLSLALFSDISFNDKMNEITVEYLKIKDTLANDNTEEVNESAKVIMVLVKELDTENLMGEHKDHFKNLPNKIAASAKELSEAKKIKSMRQAFNDLSKPMAMWATMIKPSGVNVAYCPMAPGSWLQTGKEIRNPYYGASMLKCGEIVSEGKEIKEEHVCDENCEH